MDPIDRRILTFITDAFPLEERPFQNIARSVGITEDDAVERVRSLKQTGIIRRIGAVINPGSLGWHSTLCAAEIPEDRIDYFASLVNSYTEVTHNYVRSGNPNCWFTLITPDVARSREIIRELERQLCTEILDLPARRIFKVQVSFDFREDDGTLP
jgi:DNA-binding Lrp family transcriptional regulator